MSEPIGEKEKIAILLHEYNALRQEIVNRTNQGFQLVAIGAALFVWVTQAKSDWRYWGGLVVAAFAMLLAAFVTLENINRLGRRVRQLESDINARAGEKLLIWDTEFGNGLWLDRFFGATRRGNISKKSEAP